MVATASFLSDYMPSPTVSLSYRSLPPGTAVFAQVIFSGSSFGSSILTEFNFQAGLDKQAPTDCCTHPETVSIAAVGLDAKQRSQQASPLRETPVHSSGHSFHGFCLSSGAGSHQCVLQAESDANLLTEPHETRL